MELELQLGGGVAGAAEGARRAEALGVGTVWAAEVTTDPMLSLAVAATATERVRLGTNVILAFARNAMSVAMQAWDLQRASGGRLTLAFGSQVRPHITRRFSMPWSDPVGRMEEFVEALRHIFGAFQGEHAMRYEGRHHRHTLLHPLFNPGPIEHPHIPIGLGGVGPRMTELAGRLGDGYLLHAFTNTEHQDRFGFPALDRGLASSGRTRGDIWVFGYLLLIAGDTEQEQERAAAAIRSQIAFYASSPMYRDVLDAIGCADLQPALESVVRQGRWQDLPALVDDDVLRHFALRGTLEELAPQIRARYGARYDRAVPLLPLDRTDPDRLADFIRAVRS